MNFHRVTVRTVGASGMGTVTIVDGEPFTGLRGVDVHIGMEEPNRVVFDFVSDLLETDLEGEVSYRAVYVDPKDHMKSYVAEGATPLEAWEAVAAWLREEEG